MKENIYALVDCNNFYVSCERIFRPDLFNKPVIVLSNNDGCVVSRSNEVKSLGIQMGIPYFKIYDLVKEHNITVFSSNYPLYADISNRIMNILNEFSPKVEIYSIDEAFLLLNLASKQYEEYGVQIRNWILQDVGIPTTIGIAYTKTLCKVASKIAKKETQYEGVLSLLKKKENEQYLEKVSVDDIWGVGRKYSLWLKSKGIFNAKQLKYADRDMIKRKMTIQGVRTVLELNNISCIPLEIQSQIKKSITSSRSFGKKTDSFEDIKRALAINVARAGEKLRAQNSVAEKITVFITTDPFKEEHYSNILEVKLPYRTSETYTLIKYAFQGLSNIFKNGYVYKKCGVILTNIFPKDGIQLNFFNDINCSDTIKRENIMNAVDRINTKWGSDKVRLGSIGFDNPLEMKQSLKSPQYTTNWEDMLTVKI